MSFVICSRELILFSFLILFANSQIFKGNILFYVDYINTTGPEQPFLIQTYLMTRGRFGFSFYSINSYTNSTPLTFITQLNNNGTLSYYRYIGPLNNCSLLQPDKDYTTFYLTSDNNYYPIGKRINDIFSFIKFKGDLFTQYYSQNFNVSVGFSFNKLSTPQNFDILSNVDQLIQTQFYVQNLSQTYSITAPDSTRIESINWIYWSIELAFLVIIFILCLLFSKQQPLKSRGSTPAIACIIHIVLFLSTMSRLTMTIEDLERYRCIINAFVDFPIVILIVLISILNFARYLMILKANQRKLLFIKSKSSETPKLRWPFKVLKIMSHWTFNIFVVIFSYFIITSVFLLILIIGLFDCPILQPNGLDINTYPYIVMIVIEVIIVFIVFIFDVILSFDNIKTCNLRALWKEDGFYFRIETYIFGGIFTVPYVVVIIILVTANVIPDIPQQWLYFLLVTFCYYFAFFYQVLFILIVTIITTIIKLFKKKAHDDQLKKFMSKEETYTLLLEFAKSEFSVENIVCYDDIQAYKSITNPEERLQMAQKIFDTYLNGSDSELEVNISSDFCKKVKTLISTGNVDGNLLNDVERQIIANVSDTFSRFIFTSAYLNYTAKTEYLKKTGTGK